MFAGICATLQIVNAATGPQASLLAMPAWQAKQGQ
jgi:hypothetical protein